MGLGRALSGTVPQAAGPLVPSTGGYFCASACTPAPTPALSGEAEQLSSSKDNEDTWQAHPNLLCVNDRCPLFCSGFAASTRSFSDAILLLRLLQTTRRNHTPKPPLCPSYLVCSCSQKQPHMLEKQDPRFPCFCFLPGAFAPSSEVSPLKSVSFPSSRRTWLTTLAPSMAVG